MNYTDTIEKFLNNEMNDEEKALFLAEMERNETLKNAVETYEEMSVFYDDNDWEILENPKKHSKVKQSLDFLHSNKGQNIKSIIQQEEDYYFAETPKTKKGILKIITTLSSVAALFLVGMLIFKNFGNSSTLELYSEYNNNWEELPSLTVRGNTDMFTEIETSFKQKEYQKSLTLINNVLKEDTKTTDPQLLLYLGISQLELDKNKAAIQTFTQLLQSNTLDAFKAHWYLALSYLKLDNTTLATQELQFLLADDKNFKDVEAKKILEQIKE